MKLEPRERRWVELVIEQGAGEDVRSFDVPHQVQVTGVIDNKAVGGITFYLAPPSAFPGAGDIDRWRHRHHRVEDLAELLELNIPWEDCKLEGEIDVRVRFRKD